MALREFPDLIPSSRTYRPGRQPETQFQAQNGAVSIVAFGGRFVNAELDLEFRNITDYQARLILLHYQSVLDDDYVAFTVDGPLDGMGVDLTTIMETGRDLLRYRYKAPPTIQSVYPGISTVQCSFIGLLYGV